MRSIRHLVIAAAATTLLMATMVYHRDNLAEGYDAVVSTVKETAANNNIPLPFDKDEVYTQQPPQDNYIAICVSVKDQRIDLPQFLHHHYYNMGVGKFYIMDDGTQPPLSEMTEDELGIPRSALEFHYYPPDKHEKWMQYKVYNDCARIVKNSTSADKPTWVAFIDTDEFIDAPGPESLREILEDFQRFEVIGGVGLQWRIHTSNGHLTRQPSMIDAFTECVVDYGEDGTPTDNRHIKSIVRMDTYSQPRDPHSFILTENHITIGENGDQVLEFWRSPITRNRLALHHYALKSKAEYEEKMHRGSGMSNHKNWDTWILYENKTKRVPCTEMLRWSPTRQTQATLP